MGESLPHVSVSSKPPPWNFELLFCNAISCGPWVEPDIGIRKYKGEDLSTLISDNFAGMRSDIKYLSAKEKNIDGKHAVEIEYQMTIKYGDGSIGTQKFLGLNFLLNQQDVLMLHLPDWNNELFNTVTATLHFTGIRGKISIKTQPHNTDPLFPISKIPTMKTMTLGTYKDVGALRSALQPNADYTDDFHIDDRADALLSNPTSR